VTSSGESEIEFKADNLPAGTQIIVLKQSL
jgi:hypothetical protein